MLRRKRSGQSTAEYAIVIGLVIAAAVAMQVYVKRGIQAKVADAVDYNDPDATGKYGVGDAGTQYEPNYMGTVNMITERNATEDIKVSTGGGVERNIIGNEMTTRTGEQTIYAPPTP